MITNLVAPCPPAFSTKTSPLHHQKTTIWPLTRRNHQKDFVPAAGDYRTHIIMDLVVPSSQLSVILGTMTFGPDESTGARVTSLDEYNKVLRLFPSSRV